MQDEKRVTIMVTGETGCGKSNSGCAFLQNEEAFEKDSRPDSKTFETIAKSNVIDDYTRYFIDTQGLESTDNKDAFYIQQMIEFLKKWTLGVNAFFIVINSQQPRFTSSIQTMIQIINDFFNEPNFWMQTGVIFTRCYNIPGRKPLYDEQMLKTQYRQKIIDLIHTFEGCENLQLQMPCFFVDSAEWMDDEKTKNEYTRIFSFAQKHDPVPTQKMKIASPDYKEKEEEIINNVLVSEEYQGTGIDKKKIRHYEDQKRYKIVNWQNQVYYTNPETIRKWDDTICTKVEEEKETRASMESESVFVTVKEKGGFWQHVAHLLTLTIASNGNREYQKYDHKDVTIFYKEMKRQRITDPDGNVSYTNWVEARNWVEHQTKK